MNRRDEGIATRAAILDAGLALARLHSLETIRSREIASAAGVSHTVVFYHFGTLAKLRGLIAGHALAKNDPQAIVRLIMDRHSIVADWSQRRRARYLRSALS